jgi:hypothetical protein
MYRAPSPVLFHWPWTQGLDWKPGSEHEPAKITHSRPLPELGSEIHIAYQPLWIGIFIHPFLLLHSSIPAFQHPSIFFIVLPDIRRPISEVLSAFLSNPQPTANHQQLTAN